MSASENQPAESGQAQDTNSVTEVMLHSTVVATAQYQTNQAERAAMHPDGDDLEWHYYHGGWSG